MWDWLTQTDAGLATRIFAGVLIFAILAIGDLRRHGAQATRWREYLFLLACVAAAMLYGILNDTLTSSISWEYFCYGKGLWPDVIHDLPPDPIKLHLQAALIGVKATWSAGLIIGMAMLIANNPRRDRPQVSYPSMFRLLICIAAIAAVVATILGITGYLGGLTWISHDFAEMIRRNEMRPNRFVAVFGIHLGGYVGVLLGLILAIAAILRRRQRLHRIFKTGGVQFAQT